MVMAGGVLLVVWYVGAWLLVSRAAREGMIGWGTAKLIRPAFAPLILYCDTRLPGGDAVSDLWHAVAGRPTVSSYVGPEVILGPANISQ